MFARYFWVELVLNELDVVILGFKAWLLELVSSVQFLVGYAHEQIQLSKHKLSFWRWLLVTCLWEQLNAVGQVCKEFWMLLADVYAKFAQSLVSVSPFTFLNFGFYKLRIALMCEACYSLGLLLNDC